MSVMEEQNHDRKAEGMGEKETKNLKNVRFSWEEQDRKLGISRIEIKVSSRIGFQPNQLKLPKNKVQ